MGQAPRGTAWNCKGTAEIRCAGALLRAAWQWRCIAWQILAAKGNSIDRMNIVPRGNSVDLLCDGKEQGSAGIA